MCQALTNCGRRQIPRNMFDIAQKEVFELLSRDSFPRFKKTKLFSNYLDLRKKMALARRFFSIGSARDLGVKELPLNISRPAAAAAAQ